MDRVGPIHEDERRDYTRRYRNAKHYARVSVLPELRKALRNKRDAVYPRQTWLLCHSMNSGPGRSTSRDGATASLFPESR